eukprot:3727303-Pleurochrysis_carterae.AAC.1
MILKKPPIEQGQGPLALVMAPTRELAQQIHVEAVKFAAACRIKAGAPPAEPRSACSAYAPANPHSAPLQTVSHVHGHRVRCMCRMLPTGRVEGYLQGASLEYSSRDCNLV